MSEIQRPSHDLSFDDNFDKELIQMWQENTYPRPGNSREVRRQLLLSLKKLDRRIRWRNIVEYAAAAVVLIRSGFDIASGERLLIAPLTSIAAVLFIVTYIWRKNRNAQPVDPTADASAYRTAMLQRLDRQIQLARSVRYWYVLPCWIFFLMVLASGVLKGLALGPLLAEFLLATGVCVVVVGLHEKYGARKLEAERDRVNAFSMESNNED
jgi:hypothetical protein